MDSPKFLLWLMTFFLLTFLLIDMSKIGTSTLISSSAARMSTEGTMIASLQEGAIRTRHDPRIDVPMFTANWRYKVRDNAGYLGFKGNIPSHIYQIDANNPYYAATEVDRPVISHAMTMIKQPNNTFTTSHRVVYIVDEKK